MAYVIGGGCIMCGSCAGECPVGAIAEGDGKYEINADAVRAPRLSSAEKDPPARSEHAYAVRVPQPFGAKNARPLCCFRQK